MKANEKEIEEFIQVAKVLKEDSYLDFIKIKSLATGIVIGKGQTKLNI